MHSHLFESYFVAEASPFIELTMLRMYIGFFSLSPPVFPSIFSLVIIVVVVGFFLSLRAYFKQSVENAQINSRLAILWLHHNNKFSGSRTFAKQQGKKLKLKNNNNNKYTSILYVVCDGFMTYYLGLVTVEMRCTVFNCRYDIVHKVSQLNYSSERIRLKYVPMQSKCIVEQCNNNAIHEIYQLTKVQRSNDVIINIHLLFFQAHFTPEPW